MGYPINLVTGSRGSDHITSAEDGALFAALIGRGQYVLYGFNHVLVNNNSLRIKTGDLLINGRHAMIAEGDSVTVDIENGAVGMNRIDLVVATYTNTSGVEAVELEVIKGTAKSGTPTEPSYKSGDILKGATRVQMPLFQLRITGIDVSEVTPIYETCKSIKDLIAEMIYPPVGYILMNSGADPAELYPGTTWELHGKGRVAFCYDSADMVHFGLGKTGGSITKTLETTNLPPHNHELTGHTHFIGNHTHETPEIEAVVSGGAHKHSAGYAKDVASGSAVIRYKQASGSLDATKVLTSDSGEHTHRAVVPNSETLTPKDATKTTGEMSESLNTGNTGAATPFETLDPYVVVCRWKRVR